MVDEWKRRTLDRRDTDYALLSKVYPVTFEAWGKWLHENPVAYALWRDLTIEHNEKLFDHYQKMMEAEKEK